MAKDGFVSIFGSCISRIPFNMPALSQYAVGEYISRSSILLSDHPDELPVINEDEVNAPHNFIKRCICTLLNGTAWKRLEDNYSEWIVIDTLYLTNQLYLVKSPKGKQVILQFPHNVKNEVFRIITTNVKYTGYTIEKIDAEPNYPYLIKKLVEKLGKWEEDKIIVIDSVAASCSIDESGEVSRLPSTNSLSRLYATKLLLDSIKCRYITFPSDVLCDYYNTYNTPGSMSRVHYSEEMYEYMSLMIQSIFSEDMDLQRKAIIDLQLKVASIVDGVHKSIANSEGRITSFIKGKNNSDTLESIERLCLELIEQYDRNGHYLSLGRIFHKHKNPEKAEYYCRCAIENNIAGSNELLFDILWDKKTDSSFEEMKKIAKLMAETGNIHMMLNLSRMYCEGKGFERNLEMAVLWAEKSFNLGNDNAGLYLCDLLYQSEDEEKLKRAVCLLNELSDKGYPNATARLGRAYRDGKGVERNLSMAIALFQKAVDGRIRWAQWELYDTLMMVGTEQSIAEAISIAKMSASSGNREMQGRLARAYRDGVGVETDYGEAIKWYKKAASHKLKWATDELKDLQKSIAFSNCVR